MTPPNPDGTSRPHQAFWNTSVAEMLQRLHTTAKGLTGDEAGEQLARYGANRLRPAKRSDVWSLLLRQFGSPIILILLFATGLSLCLGDRIDAFIILFIVLVSSSLGFWQERGASNAVEKLLSIVQIKAAVLRDGNSERVPVEKIVPGDVVVLDAGDVVPGDGLVLESKDLFVDEGMLTGETFPVEKAPALLPAETPLGQRSNALWMGTHVVSGTATALVVDTGKTTEFGKVSERLKLRPNETDFEQGIRQFGYFLGEVTLVLVVAIFAINVYLARPVLEAFLFSLALAVGLTPQLLPAIISVNLAHGAKRMAKKTSHRQTARLDRKFRQHECALRRQDRHPDRRNRTRSIRMQCGGRCQRHGSLHAYLNAFYETGFTNPIDEAIRSHHPLDLSGYRKEGRNPV